MESEVWGSSAPLTLRHPTDTGARCARAWHGAMLEHASHPVPGPLPAGRRGSPARAASRARVGPRPGDARAPADGVRLRLGLPRHAPAVPHHPARARLRPARVPGPGPGGARCDPHLRQRLPRCPAPRGVAHHPGRRPVPDEGRGAGARAALPVLQQALRGRRRHHRRRGRRRPAQEPRLGPATRGTGVLRDADLLAPGRAGRLASRARRAGGADRDGARRHLHRRTPAPRRRRGARGARRRAAPRLRPHAPRDTHTTAGHLRARGASAARSRRSPGSRTARSPGRCGRRR